MLVVMKRTARDRSGVLTREKPRYAGVEENTHGQPPDLTQRGFLIRCALLAIRLWHDIVVGR